MQLVDMGPNGPLRCSGCGAYMNPYMQWSNDGATFTCNLCRARSVDSISRSSVACVECMRLTCMIIIRTNQVPEAGLNTSPVGVTAICVVCHDAFDQPALCWSAGHPALLLMACGICQPLACPHLGARLRLQMAALGSRVAFALSPSLAATWPHLCHLWATAEHPSSDRACTLLTSQSVGLVFPAQLSTLLKLESKTLQNGHQP